MQKLNLPAYEFRIKLEQNRQYIYDVYRKKYLLLTPEEWVRQSFARYLVEEKSFPASLMMTEYPLKLHNTQKRCDLLVHKPAGNPAVLVECKAPAVKISEDTFDQAARYNMVFKVKYLMVTNGLSHYCCYVDFDSGTVNFLEEIPDYRDLH